MTYIAELWEGIDPEDWRLAGAFLVLALLALASGGFLGILLGLSKMPAIGLFRGSFYNLITAHATLIFMYALGLFEVVTVLILGLGLLRVRLAGNRAGWAAFGLILVSLGLQGAAFILGADTTYKVEPVVTGFKALWLQHLGYLLFAAGLLIVFGLFLVTFYRARGRGEAGTLPHLGFAMGVFALLGVFGNFTLIYTMGNGLAYDLGLREMSTSEWDHIFHLFFHMIHYVPLLAILPLWYVNAYQWGAPSIPGERFIRGIWASYLFLVPPTYLYHLLTSPELSATAKTVGSTLSLLVSVPTLISAIIVLGMMEVLLRGAGRKGWFGWIRGLPWGSPGFASVPVSALMMISGALAAGSLINAKLAGMLSETFAVPGYFHPMAGATILVFMGLSYYLVPLFTKRELWGASWARIQPYIFGGGLAIFGIAGSVAGFLGFPRRVADPTYGGGAPTSWAGWMNVWGVGAFLAILGIILFVLIVVMTPLRGRRVETSEEALRGLKPEKRVEMVATGTVKGAFVPSIVVVILMIALAMIGFQLMANWPVRLGG